jgi:hypothetical protein
LWGGTQGITLSRSASAPEMRLFRVTTAGNLLLQKLWLRGGLIRGGNGETAKGGGGGGGGGLGGAIINEGTLRIEQSTLSGHRAIGGAGGGAGDLSSFEFSGGAAVPTAVWQAATALLAALAAVAAVEPAAATATAVTGRAVTRTSATVPRAHRRRRRRRRQRHGQGGFAPITGAHAGGNGGGGGGGLGLGGAICNKSGTVQIINSTLSGNSVAGGTGGTVLSGPAHPARAELAWAGAIFNYNGSVSLTNATIAFNTGELAYYSIGEGTGNTVSLSAKSSIFSNNNGDIGSQNFENKATVSHTGTFNLIQSGGVSGSNNISGDPRLGPLAENAGVTPTHELLAGSPAIDAGLSTAPHNQDQRGFARIKDEPPTNAPGSDGSDIGSFRIAGRATAQYFARCQHPGRPHRRRCTINDCTLREAVSAAATGATIRFKPGLSGTISLAVGIGRIGIAKSLSIVGPGANVVTIAGRRNDSTVTPIFNIDAGYTVSVRG